MDQKKLFSTLNWFYSLELNQVDLYIAQSKQQGDIYIARALERFAMIEQQHVDNIAERIKELGFQPTSMGDVIAPIVGKMAGSAVALAGTQAMLRANIALEKKAMEDYKNLLHKVDPNQKLFNTLWHHLIDEDLHTAWMTNKLEELERH
ncbi:MAG: demethoxyubiquinone hydroxylase family protein [Bacillota bacterium]